MVERFVRSFNSESIAEHEHGSHEGAKKRRQKIRGKVLQLSAFSFGSEQLAASALRS
jgi:hypothetical protein